MEEKVVQFQSSWKISEKNSLGTDFDSLANVQVMINSSSDDTLDAGNFLDVVDMDHYLFFESPENNEERFVITITATKGTLSNISLVTDARNIEIFIADSGQVTSYWKTFKGKVIDELSELGSETYLHEICFDCMVRHVELKLGKTSDTQIYLFGLKVFIKPGKDVSRNNLPFLQQQNSIDFKNVETILSNSNVPLSSGAERALEFLKHSGGAFVQRTPPHMEMLMNLMNQVPAVPKSDENERKSIESSSFTTESDEIGQMKLYLDVRLKEMEDAIVSDFSRKLKDLEERQNKKFDQILELLRNNK